MGVAEIVLVLFVLLAFPVVPAGLWFTNRARAYSHWAPRVIGTQKVASGQYREASAPTFGEPEPPLMVKLAALGCWGLGQMFVPGLALGLFGLLVLIGLVSIPGLILAAKLFRLGGPLMRGEIESAAKARSLATFARVLNGITVGIVGVSAVMSLASSGNAASQLLATTLFSAPVLFYAMISLVHAKLLDLAADEVEKNFHARSADTGVRVANEPPVFASAAPDLGPASVAAESPAIGAAPPAHRQDR
jgi:hypothetical protein